MVKGLYEWLIQLRISCSETCGCCTDLAFFGCPEGWQEVRIIFALALDVVVCAFDVLRTEFFVLVRDILGDSVQVALVEHLHDRVTLIGSHTSEESERL